MGTVFRSTSREPSKCKTGEYVLSTVSVVYLTCQTTCVSHAIIISNNWCHITHAKKGSQSLMCLWFVW